MVKTADAAASSIQSDHESDPTEDAQEQRPRYEDSSGGDDYDYDGLGAGSSFGDGPSDEESEKDFAACSSKDRGYCGHCPS